MMMRNSAYLAGVALAVLFCAAFLTGCGAFATSPVTGVLYTDVKAPIQVVSGSTYKVRQGSASATSLLGLLATGDASINTAARNGRISKIHYIDYHSTNVLGIFAVYTVTVYGE